jgi:phage tail sheath protein FI
MPVTLNYPGVYIEEIPSGVRTITGVATSIAAFVGYTRQGPPNLAVPVSSFADFERSQGGLDRASPVSYAVRQFFANGGTQALVVRVATNFAAAGWVLNDGSGAVLDVTASSPGTWGNDLRIGIDHNARNPAADFNLTVSRVVPGDSGTPPVVETHRNLNLNPSSPRYVESVVNTASQLVRVDTRALTFANAGFAVGTPTFPLTVSDLVIAGVVDGNLAFRLELAGAAPANIGALVTAITAAITAANLGTRLAAAESDAAGVSPGTGSLRIASLTTGAASRVAIDAGAFGGLADVIGMGLANAGLEMTGDAQHRPLAVAGAAPSALGADGTPGGSLELIGSPAAKTGMYALLDTDLFNLLSIPETFGLPLTEADAVIGQAVALCEARRAFYLVDPPATRVLGDIADWANAVSQSRNAATYFPPVLIADPLDEFRLHPMAPSGTMAGVYARTDSTRGVWKAPAGTEANLSGVAGLNVPLNDIENGRLNPRGVNALRSFPAYGRVAWGARTMRGADAQADEYKYVPVRRLALFLEESLYRATQWVVFEPNDEPLWAQIRLNIGAFMQTLFRQGAFQGRSPREAYIVKCDRETTTQNDINLGIVNILVGFAPLKPAEFVVIRIQQMAGQIET